MRVRTIDEIAEGLVSGGPLDDEDFDLHLDPAYRRVSSLHWTPVSVAALGARWLEAAGVREVVDVGSGAGKFCVVAALSTSRLRCVGIEHRSHLVVASRLLARRFGLGRRVVFVHASVEHPELGSFEALYLYNPFGENVLPAPDWIDVSVPHGADKLSKDVATVEAALERAGVGTHLLTYNGFGGAIPDTFDVLREEKVEGSMLRLWRRRRERSAGDRWIEQGDTVTRCVGVLT